MRHEVEPQEAEADNHKGSLTAGGDSISSDYHGHLTNCILLVRFMHQEDLFG